MDSELAQTKADNGARLNRIFLEDLNITGMPRIPAGHPNLIVTIKNCSLETLTINQDAAIHILYIVNCKNLKMIRALPNEISTMIVIQCKALETIEMIPESLTALDIRGLPLLRSIPRIPRWLTGIRIQHCGVVVLPQPDEINSNLAIVGGPFRIEEGGGRSTSDAWRQFWRLQRHMKASLKEEIIAEVWHPRRVEKLIELGGWDLVESLT